MCKREPVGLEPWVADLSRLKMRLSADWCPMVGSWNNDNQDDEDEDEDEDGDEDEDDDDDDDDDDDHDHDHDHDDAQMPRCPDAQMPRCPIGPMVLEYLPTLG